MRVANYTTQRKTPIEISVTYHAAIDLLLSLWILREQQAGDGIADLDLGAEWFEELDAGMSKETRADVESLASGDVWIALVAMLPEAGQGGSVADFMKFIDGQDSVELRSRLTQCYGLIADSKLDLVESAARGESGATDKLLALEMFDKPKMKRWGETLRFLLEMSPDETKELLVRTMSGFQKDVFASHEKSFRKQLESDYTSKSSMALQISPERLIEIATSGITVSDESVSRPIVLMPTMVARPWVVISPGADFDVYGYSVADESLDLDPDAPPPWIVKVYKALGDERRLRVLRRLAQGDASLAELARNTGVAKSTLHHHLMLLRAAGLVSVEVGKNKKYSLRETTPAEAAGVLKNYMNPAHESKEIA